VRAPALPAAFAAAGDLAVAVVDGATRLSSGDLLARATDVAGGLAAAGVGRGDFVAWQRANCWQAVVLYRACWHLGAIAAPIHHLAGAAEVAAMLDDLAPRLVVGEDLPSGPPPPVAAEPDDLAAVLFTSGSSGRPKGVLHTHRALSYKATLMAAVHGLRADDAILMPAPLAHVSGLLNGVLLPGVVPMKVVLVARWSPDDALDLIERERVTFMIGPPTFFIGLMGSPAFSADRVESLRLVSCGGAGVTPAFVDEATARLGCVVKRTYGSTEAPTVTTAHVGDDPARARETDGRPTGEVEVTIAADGEVLLRGPELFVGYRDAAANAAAWTADGRFRTGDRGELSPDGWLTITGRLKDVIIRGGENVSVAEVEAVLEAHRAVRHAVALGEADARLGERVVAFVVVADGARFDVDVCREWFAARGVARFKTPERVVVIAEMPTLASGKPDRAALRSTLPPAVL
jgi:cyclohexanecarboxylate-CoA ligase